MPDINNQIVFSESEKKIIKEKLGSDSFNHNEWGLEDLALIRSSIRKFYRNAQGGKCAFCKKYVSLQSASNAQVEHILPKSKYLNFIFEPKNLCVICADCNEKKGDHDSFFLCDDVLTRTNIIRYPRSSNAFKIVHPHFDDYYENIKIFNDYIYIGLTDKGHATVGACKLNKYLQEFGWPNECHSLDEMLDLASDILEADDPLRQVNLLNRLGAMIVFNKTT